MTAPGHDLDLEAAGQVVVAVGLDRLRGIRLDGDLADGAADDAAPQVAGPEQQPRRAPWSAVSGSVPPRTMSSSRPLDGSIGWRGPIRPGTSWPALATIAR